jgi:hypothetical protein
MQTMKKEVLHRIRRMRPGKAFVAKDFLDVATRGTIDVALAALVREGTIRRVRRGLYDKPKANPSLGGTLSPDVDEAARAIARRLRWKIVPAGAWAANLLTLSTQVPAKIVYLTDGPSKTVQIGKRAIRFQHARPQALAGTDGPAALVVQALRYLGKEGVRKADIRRLRTILSAADRRKLVKQTRFGVDWIYETAKQIAGDER